MPPMRFFDPKLDHVWHPCAADVLRTRTTSEGVTPGPSKLPDSIECTARAMAVVRSHARCDGYRTECEAGSRTYGKNDASRLSCVAAVSPESRESAQPPELRRERCERVVGDLTGVASSPRRPNHYRSQSPTRVSGDRSQRRSWSSPLRDARLGRPTSTYSQRAEFGTLTATPRGCAR